MTRGRDLSTFRNVSQHVPKDADRTGVVIAQFTENLLNQAQEAKLADNASKAQLELNELDNQFRIENQNDPMNKEALKGYQEKRKEIFNKYNSTISPFYRDEWVSTTKKLADRSDINNQSWGFKQLQTNTVNDINSSIKNNLEAAAASGRKYGTGAEEDINSMLNYLPGRERIRKFAANNLGSEVAEQTLKSYDEDYMKSFISGVAEENPAKALALMDNEMVQKAAGDSATFQEFKTAVTNRAIKFQEVAIQKEIAGTIKSEMALFAEGKPMSYAQIKVATSSMSEPAQKYFLKVNGFSTKDEEKLDDSGKLQVKADIVDRIAALTKQDDVALNDLGELQAQIFDAMNKDAITEKEGINLISQLVEPTLQGKEERIEKFRDGDWNPFKSDVGFSVIEDFYDDEVLIKPQEGEDDVGALSQAVNATNKANLFDYYFQALKAEGARYVTPERPNGVNIGEISGLDKADQRRIYKSASDAAINEFRANNVPLVLKSGIPQLAIEHLIKHPEMAPDFDALYGIGTANRILGK